MTVGFSGWSPLRRASRAPWSDINPVRAEMFGVERLEQHATSLAERQDVTLKPPRVVSLQRRLEENAIALSATRKACNLELAAGHPIEPAAQWFLDNYHQVVAQIGESRTDLPASYYRTLPKLADGAFRGYPRVFGLVWAYVAHTDSHLDAAVLSRFIRAYQQVQPLTIGELWAVPITLRLVLLENLRRLSDQIGMGRKRRHEADQLADRILGAGTKQSLPLAYLEAGLNGRMSEVFAAQLAKRLRDCDPLITPAIGWLEERLAVQGSDIDLVVHHAQERQGASNVSVRNVITSLRTISEMDWPDLFEGVSLVDAKLREHAGFAAMDFASRNLYRTAVEDLARHCDHSEIEVAGLAIEAAGRVSGIAATSLYDPQSQRRSDPGWHLFAEGRIAFERQIGFRRDWSHWHHFHPGLSGYAGSIFCVTLGLLVLGLWAAAGLANAPVSMLFLALLALAALIPASTVAQILIDRLIGWTVPSTALPGLALEDGIPASLRTLVVVPTLLTNVSDMREQIEGLEVHYLSGTNGDVSFALLTDGVDAPRQNMPGDAALVTLIDKDIARLNQLYGSAPLGVRFLHLHRQRRYNPVEKLWMGWERKRGKLQELNRLLRGDTNTDYRTPDGGTPFVPSDVRYVLTLDSDTLMPRDTVRRLIGKMAHPLNRPVIDPALRRVRAGHAILQPRVTPALPAARSGTAFQYATSGPGGMDPYATAASDIYQDLFGEGCFTGKGIYDLDAFETVMAGRVPENALLSHDLLEGIFARAGLASDVELVESFPERQDLAARRIHRWCRGDWQLLPWLGRRGGLGALGRFKVLDTLRRSLLAPATLGMLTMGWLLPGMAAVLVTALVLAVLMLPSFLHAAVSAVPHRAGLHLQTHLRLMREDLALALLQTGLATAFLADASWRSLDAITRTLWRLLVSRRHLLQWTTAASLAAAPRPDLGGYARAMAPGTTLGLALAGLVAMAAPASLPLILPFAGLWLAAPYIAFRVSQVPKPRSEATLTPQDAQALRQIARRTWRYFETFVTAEDSHLPPDNFQENPHPSIAHRTSPTNIGLYLLATVAACDFGWISRKQAAGRISATLGSIETLPRLNGHFYNWYNTQDGRVLAPPYISSVDSGNLAGHLIALANACEEWAEATAPDLQRCRGGLADLLDLMEIDVVQAGVAPDPCFLATMRSLRDSLAQAEIDWPALQRLVAEAENSPWASSLPDASARSWLSLLRDSLNELATDAVGCGIDRADLAGHLRQLGETARRLAMEMDFAFLLNPERKLLSIGYSVHENALDPACYDLLASEARLASLLAVAKQDVPLRHWFRLGRASTAVRGGTALVSWAGSMFEYLMPELVMREPEGGQLGYTCRLAVTHQIAYGEAQGVPWGISESGFNARDVEFTYQYSPFGVPGLGLKRGLAGDLVIAPYATGLAAMLDPAAARRNYDALEEAGGLGAYGFYEALDFTPSRVLPGQRVSVVQSYMAHHQGMTIAAIANALTDGQIRARFHREPMIHASELLLQERLPRDIARTLPTLEEPTVTPAVPPGVERGRRISGCPSGPPISHLMSNGHYAVMLTANGGGYSRWGDIALTRWREDTTRDHQGALLHLRDISNGTELSFGPCEQGMAKTQQDVQFFEDHTTFTAQTGRLDTVLDILVSGEADAEVRRLSITNSGRSVCDLDVTSYVELTLAAPTSEAAHPTFSRMFVQTDFLPEYGALIAWRRRRNPDEPEIWAAQFMSIEGETIAPLQYDSDRATALGRDQEQARPRATTHPGPLAGRTGTVLDPVFALRNRLRVAPGDTARLMIWMVAADSREALIDLIDRHHDSNAYDRARTLAWTQAQVQLRHLGISPDEAANFQRLAAPILYHDARFRPPAAVLAKGAGRQSGLWPLAISGDLPIVLLRIDDPADIGQVRALLQAHEYWLGKQLSVDLVILNENPASYVKDLQAAIDTALRSSHSRPRSGEQRVRGAVYALRSDLVAPEARAQLLAAARVVLLARRGKIGDQLVMVLKDPDLFLAEERLADIPPEPAGYTTSRTTDKSAAPDRQEDLLAAGENLEFFNGTGGFDQDGREYVILLGPNDTTPAPWINVIANPGFGFQVSASGSGFTWAENSRDNQLTPWSNDAVADPAGEAFYIRDDDSGALISPTIHPLRKTWNGFGEETGPYIVRHGFGYSKFEHQADGIACDLVQFVPREDPVRVSVLRLKNTGEKPRHLSVAAYSEPVMGVSRAASAPFLVSSRDSATGALLVCNPWNTTFPGRVMFTGLYGPGAGVESWTGDRTEFLGSGGSAAAPAAMHSQPILSGRLGAGFDPCLAQMKAVVLAPGESVELLHLLGQCTDTATVGALVRRLRSSDPLKMLADVQKYWTETLGALQIETPDRAMDIMVNGWLPYQTLACRIEARAAFYQASGAYGFRDQLQDNMALTLTRPRQTRAHLLRAAARQFPEGDVQHWWLPHSGQGVRTRISDDCVWLGHAVAAYVASTGDTAVLDERVPFLEGHRLCDGEHDAFFLPDDADDDASLFTHCVLGLDRALTLTSPFGLPLIGTGDWNDGMNRVGAGGRGESIWLGWLLLQTLNAFIPLAEPRDTAIAQRWRTRAETLRQSMETNGWDGDWYRRATFDDGTWLGTASARTCRIDAIVQSWAVLSGQADPARATRAMEAFDRLLVNRDDGLSLLFTPPFGADLMPEDNDPGYIAAYPPGLRENGGQYSHAAMWAILAWARLGRGDRAAELFSLVNPINHTRTEAAAQLYKTEPYAVAADVYSVAPHIGRGGWSWYTGSAAWMHRAAIEGILGITREGNRLRVAPNIPADWPGFSARLKVADTLCEIRVVHTEDAMARLDGLVITAAGPEVFMPLDGVPHDLVLGLSHVEPKTPAV
ncbi:GH36-type glycosyl hydrolase domain-containing protein [Roseibium suaedae]|uniref:Cyclic beta-1,2-glucan synthetase n=1 Tax=Roseibium suaedae TaxID=735517 RepID=A0A1M7PIF6_9HYPH|nr:glucoamylase family protein [Roseibium suaedae]SHN16741.1 cyclic beta-1,2-glucan synthetase [Roseibium suaedae]